MPRAYNWEAVQDKLVELYLIERLPLKNIMDIMKEKYGFTPR